MALYRTVSMSFWTDSKVLDTFTPEDKYFYLYLFTNPHTNLCGCYEISMKQVVVETGYSRETIENLIYRFETVHKAISYCAETKEILLINWHKYNWTSSEKFRKPLLSELNSIKNEKYAEYLMKIFNGENAEYGIDTNCIDTSVTNTNTNTVTNTVSNNKRQKRFVPPTLEEVTGYINENMYIVKPEVFYDYYEANGWTIGGKGKMKDWKATVRNWERREQEKKQPNKGEWAF